MSMRGTSRNSLPTISNPQLSYSQRYEHMTKLANYSEMNETQIWKEYQKLRACLKELNEEVLRHMEKKAYGSIGKDKTDKPSKDQEGTLVVLDDQKKANETRMNTYNNELARHEERIKYLASKPNLLDELNNETAAIHKKMKEVTKENKNLKRNAEIQGRDLVNNTSILDKIMLEETKLTRVFKQHKKYQEHLKTLNEKIERFRQKITELQKAIDLRVQQFSRGQNYIAQEIHYERYEELKKQREGLGKYEAVYKRNYLMKLKQLQSLVTNIAKQDRITQETEANILAVRAEIETITQLVGANYKRRNHSSSMAHKKGQDKHMSVTQMDRRQPENAIENELSVEGTPDMKGPGNDKNKQ